MTASEFAFLALGLVLGVASGAALVVVLGARPPAREVRLTVSHDAIPRRAATLSSDAFLGSEAEPARGGPADRRRLNRSDGPADHGFWERRGGPFVASAAVPMDVPGRTSVSFAASPRTLDGTPARLGGNPTQGANPAQQDRDPRLDALRIEAVIEARRMYRADIAPSTGEVAPVAPVASVAPVAPVAPVATMERDRSDSPPSALTNQLAPMVPDAPPSTDSQVTTGSQAHAPDGNASIEGPDPAEGIGVFGPEDDGAFLDATPALTRILRGDHHALFAVAAALAGPGAQQMADRRAWEAAIRSTSQAVVARTIDEGCLDFPVGNAFWDTFTVEQCRAIARALAASGFRFDGVDGWADGRKPLYRDLTLAVAGIGLEPRRIRAWPTSEGINDLYLEVTAAPDEFLERAAPGLDREALREILGPGGDEQDRIWTQWERVRAILTAPIATD